MPPFGHGGLRTPSHAEKSALLGRNACISMNEYDVLINSSAVPSDHARVRSIESRHVSASHHSKRQPSGAERAGVNGSPLIIIGILITIQ